jgi:hypothetical protein
MTAVFLWGAVAGALVTFMVSMALLAVLPEEWLTAVLIRLERRIR